MARWGRGVPLRPVITSPPPPGAIPGGYADDQAYATDQVVGVLSLAARVAVDSAPAADTAARAALTLTRAAADTAGGGLDAVVGLAGRFVYDSCGGGTDTAARAPLARFRSIVDSAPAVDTAQAFYKRTALDTAPAADTVSRVLTFGRAVTDTAPAGDVVTRVHPKFRSVQDTAPAADVAVRAPFTPARLIPDTAPATDTAARAVLYRFRTAADSAPADDTLSYFVVGTGGATQLANPNWPLVGLDVDFGETAGPPTAPPGPNRKSLNARYRRMTARRIGIKRGRQYELDQVQAGECTVEIVDPEEILNADNPASPFNTGGDKIAPYRPFRTWAMWPNQPGSGNLLNQNVVLGADPSFESGTGCLDAMVSGTGTFVVSTAQAFDGAQSVKVTQAGAGQSYGVFASSALVTAPDFTYVASVWVYPTAGCTVTMAVVDAAGGISLGNTASVSGQWKRLYVPWTAVDTTERVVIFGANAAAPTFYVDAMQVEFGPVPTDYAEDGPTLFPLFTGYVERFPTAYDMDGYRAIRPMVAVDALALLALTSINQSYSTELAKDTPQFTMPLNDKAGPPQIKGNPAGFGTFTNISGGSIDFSGDSMPDGSSATALTQQIQASGGAVSTTVTAYSGFGATRLMTADTIEPGSYIVIEQGTIWEEWAQVTAAVPTFTTDPDTGVVTSGAPYALTVTLSPFGIVGLQSDHVIGGTVTGYLAQDTVVNTSHHAGYSVNFAGATFEGWFKPTAGDVTMLLAGENLTGAVPTWSNTRPASKRDTFLGIQSTSTGLYFVLNDSRNGPSNWLIPASPFPAVNYAHYPDGQWHYYAFKLQANPANPAQYQWFVYVDQNGAVPGPIVGSQAMRRVRFNQLVTAASTYTGAPQSVVSAGQIAYYPYALPDDRILAHARRGTGNKGEVTGARLSRLLTQYWGGAVILAPGSLGMADDFTYDPVVMTATATTGAGQNRALLDVAQEIQETERGLLYANLAGAIVFEDRTSRYLNQTPVATLGEDPGNDGSELPYEAYETDFDPTYAFSQANLTSPYNGDFLPIVNEAARAKYGYRVLTQQLQVVSDFDLEQAGIFYLTRYGEARTRITKVTLKPSANPALWPIALAMEISQRYTVHRRNQTGVQVTGDYYVESVSHTIDPESGDWLTELQMSPVFVESAWILGDETYGVLGSTTAPVY